MSLFKYKKLGLKEQAPLEPAKRQKTRSDAANDETVQLPQGSSKLENEQYINEDNYPNNDNEDNSDPKHDENDDKNQDNKEEEQPPPSFENLELLLPLDWRIALQSEFKKPYWAKLKQQLSSDRKNGQQIFPELTNIFTAFHSCKLSNIKVVVIGQDPYHDDGQAMGLSFSVPKTLKKLPPSLKNIYKELQDDIPGFVIPTHGDLTLWAQQGVFLLNTVLTVKAHNANSHKAYGWLEFTDAVVKVLASRENLVWLLWGKPAQDKAKAVKKEHHCILKSVHPSPLSASRGWFGSKHFSKCNAYLKKMNKKEIKWQV